MYGSHFTHGDFVRVSSIVIADARDFSTIGRSTVRVSRAVPALHNALRKVIIGSVEDRVNECCKCVKSAKVRKSDGEDFA